MNFWYDLLWPSGMAFWNGLLVWPSGISFCYRCGSSIWSRGAQVLRPKVADVAKWSRVSEASKLWWGSRALKQALKAFGFLMFKYAFSHILETLFL